MDKFAANTARGIVSLLLTATVHAKPPDRAIVIESTVLLDNRGVALRQFIETPVPKGAPYDSVTNAQQRAFAKAKAWKQVEKEKGKPDKVLKEKKPKDDK